MPDGLPQVQLVIWGMLLAATPTTAYAVMCPSSTRRRSSRPLAPEFDADRLILITLSMIAIGVVGLIIWDGVFPDRRDVRILGVLPIPTRRFVLGRLASLGRVFVLFAMPLCTLQSVIFGMTVTGYGGPMSAHSRHRRALRHRRAGLRVRVLRADRGAVPAAAGVRPPRRAGGVDHLPGAVRGRPGAAAVLPPRSRARAALGGATHEGLGRLSALPPTWFFGLLRAAGRHRRRRSALRPRWPCRSRSAPPRGGGALRVSYPPVAASARRRLGAPRRRWCARLAGTRRARAASTGRSRPRCARFTVRTLVRSRTHRMMFAVYGGFALALIMSSALSVALRDNGAGFWQPGLAMMSMPLDRPVPAARRDPGDRGDPVGAEGALGLPRLRAGRSPRRRQRHPRRDAAADRRADHRVRAAAGAGVLDARARRCRTRRSSG